MEVFDNTKKGFRTELAKGGLVSDDSGAERIITNNMDSNEVHVLEC